MCATFAKRPKGQSVELDLQKTRLRGHSPFWGLEGQWPFRCVFNEERSNEGELIKFLILFFFFKKKGGEKIRKGRRKRETRRRRRRRRMKKARRSRKKRAKRCLRFRLDLKQILKHLRLRSLKCQKQHFHERDEEEGGNDFNMGGKKEKKGRDWERRERMILKLELAREKEGGLV